MERQFYYRGDTLDCKETVLCGIINVTPDSFSDGGKYFGVELAVQRAKELIAQGAKMLDIGGESTRPGSTYVDIQEEINRVVPVVKAIKSFSDIPISVDTWKSEVAQATIDAGVDIINDITGLLGDKNMAKVIGNSDVGFIAMFNPVIARPHHESSKIFPKFTKEDVFTEKEQFTFDSMPIHDVMSYYFKKVLSIAQKNGISKNRMMLDVGIGFGLTKRENFMLLNHLSDIHQLGCCAFLGVSRKRFITTLLEENHFDVDMSSEKGVDNRDEASAVLTALAAVQGVEVLRVHTIPKHLMAIKIADAVRMVEQVEDENLKAYQ
ncbi:dihydropteroate synthase [Granulicatella sp. zg-ZJ]|uniref:dihydropteroate synthase n=1 Tax=Granulicatella sp. zg-ZJ TaxID=2678504 RepID=UPI0013D22DC7|nr:dihydropteroate synthase [Granulicatella sp. zg-ZJ]NEW61951.1 dihydropteroate synthase [Granulicatella sp. zg-ZJ]